jgi:hypothetical protein
MVIRRTAMFTRSGFKGGCQGCWQKNPKTRTKLILVAIKLSGKDSQQRSLDRIMGKMPMPTYCGDGSCVYPDLHETMRLERASSPPAFNVFNGP